MFVNLDSGQPKPGCQIYIISFQSWIRFGYISLAFFLLNSILVYYQIVQEKVGNIKLSEAEPSGHKPL